MFGTPFTLKPFTCVIVIMPLVFIFNIIASERHLLILWTILGLPYYTLMFNFKNAHYTWNLLYSRFNFLCYTFKDEQIYLYFLIYCYIWCILFFNYKTDITWLILVASSEIIYLLLPDFAVPTSRLGGEDIPVPSIWCLAI